MQRALSAVDNCSGECLHWQEAKREVHFLNATGELRLTDVGECMCLCKSQTSASRKVWGWLVSLRLNLKIQFNPTCPVRVQQIPAELTLVIFTARQMDLKLFNKTKQKISKNFFCPLTCVISASGSSSCTSIWANCKPCSGLIRITFRSRKIQSGV